MVETNPGIFGSIRDFIEEIIKKDFNLLLKCRILKELCVLARKLWFGISPVSGIHTTHLTILIKSKKKLMGVHVPIEWASRDF